ncbi:uncharacterized protein NPIL_109231 [Nephila pilipes]|uniref:Uncharacterized protein n=1 Tax=Nephila pilipes TaxID=299642 RepID=A0A8X6T400_NEPPI|nr:uncharacterized protein NPIL_109231 [Nephila pilipes]
MIIRHHGGVELLAIIWMLMTFVVKAQNDTGLVIDTPSASNITELQDHSTTIDNAEISPNSNYTVIESLAIQVEDNSNDTTDIEGLVKSQRRAARFDTAGSNAWVRVYNHQPGTKTNSYFNYETRGNTSAHTSGEGWDSLRKDAQKAVIPINRRESKTKDILRVKSKPGITPSPKQQNITETNPSSNVPVTATEAPEETTTASSVLTKKDNLNKGYIVWSSNDGGPSGGWTFDNPNNKISSQPPSLDNLVPKDGTKWKVIGEGGEDGWQVVDDKGDVEWKIEYDDGEWRVTSTGDIPVDAEWADPDYIWGPDDGSLSEEDEYNSWSADDYAYSPWVDPVVYVRGIGNNTWPKSDAENQGAKSSDHTSTSAENNSIAEKDQLNPKEPIRFGARRKIPEKDTSSAQDQTNEVKSDTADDSKNKNNETPQADQITPKGKSWLPNQPTIKTGQKWIQGYGTKSWEVDNTGINTGFGGETWITASKDFPNGPWVPKTAGGQIQEVPKNINSVTQDIKVPENPIRAWGTGYGSKTWKGNEWDSNVVWKTGFNGALPWDNENSTNTWKFPDQSREDSEEKGKKNIVWSQPLPSEDNEPVSNPKPTNPPQKSLGPLRIKWPTKPTISGNIQWKTPPSRRTEEESWGDDSSEGGVVWKETTEVTPTDAPTGDIFTQTNTLLNKGWQIGDWLSNQNVAAKPITFAWKNKPPQKTSNLISVNWKSDETTTDTPPVVPAVWNQGQWPGSDQNGFPTWIFSGCKLQIKCGSTESDSSDDDSAQTTPQDTPDDDSSLISTNAPTTTVAKGWPVNQFKGKSWRPPTKSWKPPPTKSWKPPKKSSRPPSSKQPPPTMPDTPPPTPPPSISWKKPPPPPNMGWKKPPPGWKQSPPSWKQPTPPTTTLWTEATTPPPSISWKPPPPSTKWKKPGPRPRPNKSWNPGPTKSWKPPPTKSWKPPTPPKSWQPSIATPAPDTWSTQPKPDCKDTSETTKPTPEPNVEDGDDEEINPPHIIIITKLPNNQKGLPPPPAPPSTDKWDTRDDRKPKRPPTKSWNFPARKVNQKNGKNRKDMAKMINKWPIRPRKISKPGNKAKGWPKGIPPPTFTWPGNSMRRWTTKKPTSVTNWKPPKYMKSKLWKQMFRKWMSSRM